MHELYKETFRIYEASDTQQRSIIEVLMQKKKNLPLSTIAEETITRRYLLRSLGISSTLTSLSSLS